LNKKEMIRHCKIALIISAVFLAFSTALVASQEITKIEIKHKETKIPLTIEKHKYIDSDYRGWNYLVEKLKADGVEDAYIDAIYKDKRMPLFETIYFSLKPREPHSVYAGFKHKSLIKSAHQFLKLNKEIFDEAEKKYFVSRYAIASIMLVESHFGKNTGQSLIVNRLSRVGSIAEPNNIISNFLKHKKLDDKVTYEEVEARAKHLEKQFYPEILALIEIAKKDRIDLLELRGSYAGAFGMPQFLPSTFLRFAVDGNKDGRISIFNEADTALSIAHYLSSFGWKDNASREEKAAVVWHYNHSEAYVDTILDVAKLIENYKPVEPKSAQSKATELKSTGTKTPLKRPQQTNTKATKDKKAL
jgi:membrane-bound lytic murein transglycosylase B